MTEREARRLLNRISKMPDWIDSALTLLEKLVKARQNQFAQHLLSAIIDTLEVEDGKLKFSRKNKRFLAKLNEMQSSIRSSTFSNVIARLQENISHIISENIVYYGVITPDKKLFKATTENISEVVNSRLGLKKDGSLEKEGWMQGMLDSPEVAKTIKDYAHQAITSRSGFESFRKGLKELIEGSEGKLGAFERYFRNYAYDVYSQVDALQNKLMAEDLGLVYFRYIGSVVKASRAFCLRKKNRVFHIDDTKSWGDEPDNIAKPPNYDPLIHRGGYGCIDKIVYISEEMAKALGYGKEPDQYKPYAIKQFANGGEIITSDLVDVNLPDYERVYNAAYAFARLGHKVEIKPKFKNYLNPLYKAVYGDLTGTSYERRNPDLYIDGLPYEHEGYITTNAKRAFKNMINGGQAQSSRIIIDEVMLTERYMKRNIFDRITREDQVIDEVWILSGKEVRLLYKK